MVVKKKKRRNKKNKSMKVSGKKIMVGTIVNSNYVVTIWNELTLGHAISK